MFVSAGMTLAAMMLMARADVTLPNNMPIPSSELRMEFCRISDASQCETVVPVLDTTVPLTLGNCHIAGLEEGSKWVNQHPQYKLVRVSCSVGRKLPKKLI